MCVCVCVFDEFTFPCYFGWIGVLQKHDIYTKGTRTNMSITTYTSNVPKQNSTAIEKRAIFPLSLCHGFYILLHILLIRFESYVWLVHAHIATMYWGFNAFCASSSSSSSLFPLASLLGDSLFTITLHLFFPLSPLFCHFSLFLFPMSKTQNIDKRRYVENESRSKPRWQKSHWEKTKANITSYMSRMYDEVVLNV